VGGRSADRELRLGATTVVWGATSRGRVELAERDVRGLAGPHSSAAGLEDRQAHPLVRDTQPRTAKGLL
jgi:hypothetical protein